MRTRTVPGVASMALSLGLPKIRLFSKVTPNHRSALGEYMPYRSLKAVLLKIKTPVGWLTVIADPDSENPQGEWVSAKSITLGASWRF